MAQKRYRCKRCGNLTRFTVTRTVRSRAYHHFTLGGDVALEDQEVLSETVEKVECRWCSDGGEIEEIAALTEKEPELNQFQANRP